MPLLQPTITRAGASNSNDDKGTDLYIVKSDPLTLGAVIATSINTESITINDPPIANGSVGVATWLGVGFLLNGIAIVPTTKYLGGQSRVFLQANKAVSGDDLPYGQLIVESGTPGVGFKVEARDVIDGTLLATNDGSFSWMIINFSTL